jgi:hypothetical protein
VRSATAAHPALRLAGLLVVLAGLFGMHGLSGQSSALSGGLAAGHGAAGMSMQTTTPTASLAVVAASSVSMDVADLAVIPPRIVSDAGLLVGRRALDQLESDHGFGQGDSGGMAMGAMCLAILAAALLAMMLLLHRARVAPVLWSLPRRASAIVPRGRDPDPPSLIRLSIQRC